MLATWPGESGGKGAAFPLDVARRRADDLTRRFVGGRTVVLLGQRTAAAFRVRARYFERVKMRGAVAVVVPHPSGVNRWYNDAANVRRMRRFMRALIRSSR